MVNNMKGFKETEIGLIPEDWEVIKLDNYLVKTNQRDPRKKPNSKFTYIDVSSVDNNLYRITNVSILNGNEAPSRARKEVLKNDIIYATVRPTLKRISKISDQYDKQICSTGYCVLRLKKELHYDFLYQTQINQIWLFENDIFLSQGLGFSF